MNSQTDQTTTTADESAIRTFHHHRVASWTHRIQRTGTLGVMCRIDAQLVRI
ncbi:hypothetical protein I8751_09430 [Nostocaceae cyanobacterium CENA357]|uniref:Uncharacterized protein n=1 Tax=Atlanticothrix silvestris CENA357 TaxID=1725252 RepID=A0A8J7HHE1_9CYAN|nr:hypothetical protein [Atlanticothrix silvestris]MBH8552591.1 hypothetical protein [Atlanticothrix silvestris CENA357]